MDARELKNKKKSLLLTGLPPTPAPRHEACREMGRVGFSLRAIFLGVSEGN